VTTTVAPSERAVSLVLEAEIMADADTGRLALIASTDHHMSDLADVSPARLRRMVDEARTRLDEFERLAIEFEARDTLNAILAEHSLTMIEASLGKLADVDGALADRLDCWLMEAPDGRGYVVVPEGQDPSERLRHVSAFVARRIRQVVTA